MAGKALESEESSALRAFAIKLSAADPRMGVGFCCCRRKRRGERGPQASRRR